MSIRAAVAEARPRTCSYLPERAGALPGLVERLWARTAAYRARNYDILAAPQESKVQFRLILDAVAAQDRERLAELLQRPVTDILARARAAMAPAEG